MRKKKPLTFKKQMKLLRRDLILFHKKFLEPIEIAFENMAAEFRKIQFKPNPPTQPK